MNILFLTSEGFDAPNANNHLTMTLLEDMLGAGLGVYLVCSCGCGAFCKGACVPPALLEKPAFSCDFVERAKIEKSHFIRRYYEGVRFAFQACKKWRKKKDGIDAVLLQSNPNSVYNALLLALFLKKPIVYNVYDVFPGHAHEIGVIKSRFVFEVFRWLQKLLYALCTKIVAMSEDMRAALMAEGVRADKIEVILNWYDTNRFKEIPTDTNKFIERYKLPTDKFTVQFAGTLGYVFDYDMFISTAALLAGYPDIVFLLIGDGGLKNEILKEIERRGVKNILYYPWQPLELVIDVYSACDIGIIPLKRGVIGNGVPSKACQLMACGRVVLNVVEPSAYSRIFERYHVGVSVTDYNPHSVADKILELYHDRTLAEAIGKNAREYAHKYYTREVNTEKFVKLFLELPI